MSNFYITRWQVGKLCQANIRHRRRCNVASLSCHFTSLSCECSPPKSVESGTVKSGDFAVHGKSSKWQMRQNGKVSFNMLVASRSVCESITIHFLIVTHLCVILLHNCQNTDDIPCLAKTVISFYRVMFLAPPCIITTFWRLHWWYSWGS